jgi:hypothetical protein
MRADRDVLGMDRVQCRNGIAKKEPSPHADCQLPL